jgi:hypothetical protein
MLIAWDNKADAAALSATSEQASLPGSNVQQPHLSRKWYTAAGVKSAELVLDLGAATSVGLLGLFGANLSSAATLLLRASNSDPTGVAGDLYNSGTVGAGVVDGYGAVYFAFGAVSARYWRLGLTDNTVADNLRIGRLFLGPKWTPSVGQLYGWSIGVDDPSIVEESYGGQSYPDVRPQKRVLQFELSYMDESEMYTNAFAMARAAGLVDEVLVIPFETGSFISQQSVWGLLSSQAPLVHANANIFRQKYSVRERL